MSIILWQFRFPVFRGLNPGHHFGISGFWFFSFSDVSALDFGTGNFLGF